MVASELKVSQRQFERHHHVAGGQTAVYG